MEPTAQTPEPSPPAKSWGELVALPELKPAHLALNRVLKRLVQGKPDRQTPLVIHGGLGVGKSALIQTLLTQLAAHPSGLAAQLVTGRDFPNSFDDPTDWDSLASSDLAICESLEQLPARASLAFERWLDHRTRRQRPTVLTSSTGPALLSDFPARIVSRLSAGLVVSIPPWSPASRRLVLAHVASIKRVALTDDALDWLASHSTGGGVRPGLGQVQALSTLR